MGGEKKSGSMSEELEAMKAVSDALEPLEPESRGRVVRWAAEWCGLQSKAIPSPVTAASSASSSVAQAESIPLPDFFSERAPTASWEKALVVSYWVQASLGDQDFPAYSVSKELKNLGDGVSNITHALSSLIDKKFVIQTRKSGTSKQAQKLYKVTVKGKQYVERNMGGQTP
jgi:hypothetical protein